jgi:hypothetical protein
MNRVAQIFVGFLLLAAASLKAQALSVRLAALPGVAWARVLEAAVEWILAVWLVTGIAPRWASRTAVCFFLAFAAVSGRELLLGRRNCGCFGNLQIRPIWTLMIDVLALSALLPRVISGAGDGDQRLGRFRRGPRIAFLLVLSVALPIALVAGERVKNALRHKRAVEVPVARPESS